MPPDQTRPTTNSPVQAPPQSSTQVVIPANTSPPPNNVAPTPPPPAATQPDPTVSTISSKYPKSNLALLAISAILILSLSAGAGYYYFYHLPKQVSAEYIKNSQPILANLKTEVNRLYDEDFSVRKNVLEDNEEAQVVLLKHTENTKVTISKISALNHSYNNLKVSRFDTAQAEKNKQAFFLAHTITTDYLASLKLSSHIFAAYNDSLMDKLQAFSQIFKDGGNRADFVAAANNVIIAADEAITKLNALKEPNQDDQAFYDNMVQSLKDIQYYFTKIRQYYVSGDDHLGTAEIIKLLHKIETNNQTTEEIVKDYVENSTIAERFRTFKSLDI